MNKRDSTIHTHTHIYTRRWHNGPAVITRKQATCDIRRPYRLAGEISFLRDRIFRRGDAPIGPRSTQWFFIINARGVSIIFMSLIHPVTHDAYIILLPFPRIYKEIGSRIYCMHLKACGRRDERKLIKVSSATTTLCEISPNRVHA